MNKVSDRLTIEEHNGKRIIVVDYKGLKEKEMIELLTSHVTLTLDTKLNFLADFNNTYVTPGYMNHARKFVELTKSIVDKGALLGVDPIKAWILKGILYAYPVNYKAFKSSDEAIAFLTSTTAANS